MDVLPLEKRRQLKQCIAMLGTDDFHTVVQAYKAAELPPGAARRQSERSILVAKMADLLLANDGWSDFLAASEIARTNPRPMITEDGMARWLVKYFQPRSDVLMAAARKRQEASNKVAEHANAIRLAASMSAHDIEPIPLAARAAAYEAELATRRALMMGAQHDFAALARTMTGPSQAAGQSLLGPSYANPAHSVFSQINGFTTTAIAMEEHKRAAALRLLLDCSTAQTSPRKQPKS